MEKQFTFELLVHGLADVHSSMRVREMFARLANSLWVDRAPQRIIAIPQLTRWVPTPWVLLGLGVDLASVFGKGGAGEERGQGTRVTGYHCEIGLHA